MPPIFQPELAAEAVCYAADHSTRELYLGGPTVMTVLANKLAAGLVERYLAKTGFAGEQNLEEVVGAGFVGSVGGDHGAHGVFDDQAKARSWQGKRAATPQPPRAGRRRIRAGGGRRTSRRSPPPLTPALEGAAARGPRGPAAAWHSADLSGQLGACLAVEGNHIGQTVDEMVEV